MFNNLRELQKMTESDSKLQKMTKRLQMAANT